MSSTGLERPADPSTGLPVGPPTPAAQLLRRAVDRLAERRSGELTDADVAAELVTVRAQIGRLEALCAERLAGADDRGIAATAGAPSTQAWYRHVAELHPGEANRQVRHARALADDLPALRDAGVAGKVCWSKVRIAAASAAATPEHLFAEVQDALLGAVGELGVPAFEQLCRQARARAESLLGRDGDRRAYRDRYLRVSPVGDLVVLDGQFDRADGEVLLTALDALGNPATTPTTGKPGERDDQGKDLRTAGQRRADALVWLATHGLNTADLPAAAGHRPHLNILVDLDTLQAESRRVLGDSEAGLLDTDGEAGLSAADLWERRVTAVAELLPELAAGLADGAKAAAAGRRGSVAGACAGHNLGVLPPADLLRFACDATLRRIISDGNGEPLDVGRAGRTIPTGLRAALTARDRGCVHPGCDRPPSWCEVHHLIHYLHGGPTCSHNSGLLCEHHHRWAHKSGHTYARGPDRRWRIIGYDRALSSWRRTGSLPGQSAGSETGSGKRPGTASASAAETGR